MRIDARIPVRLAPVGRRPAAGPAALLVLTGDGDRGDGQPWAAVRVLPITAPDAARPAGHAGNCPCCAGRDGFAVALGALVRERAVGSLPFFREVVIEAPERVLEEVAGRLRSDPSLSSRYRLDQGPREN